MTTTAQGSLRHGLGTRASATRTCLSLFTASLIALAVFWMGTYWGVVDNAHPGVLAASENEVSRAAHTRDKYGLSSDLGTVRSLVGTERDVGSELWGIPMTREEANQVDMKDRLRFEGRALEGVIPFAAALPGFAGAYFDQSRGGRLVILHVNPTDSLESDIRSRMPGESRGLTIKEARHTRRQLEQAHSDAFATWESTFPNIPVEGFAVDDQHNALVVNVLSAYVDKARDRGEEFERLVGVRVRIVESGPGEDLVCNDRSHCRNPLRAGVQIYGGYLWNASKRCSMGFHIWVPNSEANSSPNRQFLTAGHCTYLANGWYHWNVGGDGHIGGMKNTQYDNSYARDIARVAITESSEISHRIYGEPTAEVVHQPLSPSQGMNVCMSLPRYNTNKTAQGQDGQGIITCGTVAATCQSWKSETANRTVHGAAIDSNEGKTARKGDSGSPIYKLQWQAGGTLHLYPVGILDHERYPGASEPTCPADAYGCHDFYFAVIASAFNHAEWDQITIYD